MRTQAATAAPHEAYTGLLRDPKGFASFQAQMAWQEGIGVDLARDDAGHQVIRVSCAAGAFVLEVRPQDLAGAIAAARAFLASAKLGEVGA